MTRTKKKVPSVAGHKFVPIKQEKRDTADQEEYKARKRKNLAKKKRSPSTYEKNKQAEMASSGQTDKSKAGAKRGSRLKHAPAEIEQASKAILNSDEAEESSS